MHSYDSIACHALCCRTHTVGLLIFLTVETTLNNDEKIKVGDKFISILGICRCVSFTIWNTQQHKLQKKFKENMMNSKTLPGLH